MDTLTSLTPEWVANIWRDNALKSLSKQQKLLQYYEVAGPDYATWSRAFNMHFGYYQQNINPFNLEAMLSNMNRKVMAELGLNQATAGAIVLDMGCGLGASLRYGSEHFPQLKFAGLTIVPWQIEKGKEINKTDPGYDQIALIEGDYTQTPFADESVDYIYAIESGCYASGADKADLLKEIHRILVPGGKFVIADGFLKGQKPLKGWLQKVYRKLCDSWALDELGHIDRIHERLTNLGFDKMEFKDVSWRVAPSVAHVPAAVLTFLIRQVLFGKEPMKAERWDNLKSPLLTMILGLARKNFGYYLVSGRKPKSLHSA